METALLSQHPELLLETANLLNSEWKRSISARVQSLEKSACKLPDSLLLIETNENGKRVIGHSRLTRVLEDPYGCWIGSVVIAKEERKKGHGKFLMHKTEEYARTFQFTTVYLNTRDQQGFYEHLGYMYCEPVSSINSDWNGCVPKNIISQRNWHRTENSLVSSTNNPSFTVCDRQSAPTNSMSVPPPPPPLPTNNTHMNNNNLKSNLGQYWMKKKL